MSEREWIRYQEGVLFFCFINQKFMSHFDFVPVIPVSPDTILKERCLG